MLRVWVYLICSLLIGSISVSFSLHEKKNLPPLPSLQEFATHRFNVSFDHGDVGTVWVRWNELSPSFFSSSMADVFVNGDSACTQAMGSCQLEGIRPCILYSVKICRESSCDFRDFRAPPKALKMCDPQFVVPAKSSPWKAVLGGFVLKHGVSRYADLSCTKGALESKGLSQLVVFRKKVRTERLRISIGFRSSKRDIHLMVSVDLYFEDKSATRDLLHVLNEGHASWQVKSMGFVCPKKIAGVRVTIISKDEGFVHINQVILSAKHVDSATLVNSAPETDTVLSLDNVQIRSFLSKREPSPRSVSLVVHVLTDTLSQVFHMAKTWNGPVVVVIWKSSHDDYDIVQKFRRFSKIVQENVDLHLVEKSAWIFSPSHQDTYPINFLRNVGLLKARTLYVLEVESGWIPCPTSSVKKYVHLLRDRSVVAIPAFSYNFALPKTKSDVIERFDKNEVFQNPNFDVHKWFQSDVVYPDIDVAKDAQFVLMQKNVRWDERFVGMEGKDRVARMRQLFNMGFEFFVAPDVFLMKPYEKEKQGRRKEMSETKLDQFLMEMDSSLDLAEFLLL